MQESAKVKVAINVDAQGQQIAEMSAHIDAAMHRLLTTIREFDITSGWHVQGALSYAHWLAWRVGWDLRTARERVRVARRLAELPLVNEELRNGAMSYSQARAISRVATAENEELWVAYAKRMPASQLDILCRSYENVQAYDQAHRSEAGAVAGAVAAAHVAAQRTVTRRTLDNGMVKFEIVVASDEAAIVWAALNAGIAKAPAATAPTSAAPTLAAQATSEPGSASSSTVDQTPAEPSDLAMMADGEVIATATARRLCCDAGVVVAHIDPKGQPLSVGRKTRTVSAAIKRASHSRCVDGHHIEHWANGGATALSNLMLLCSAHHTLLHEGGCRVEANSTNGWNFFDHRNRLVDGQPARTPSSDVGARHGLAALHDAHAVLAITAATSKSKWTGEPIDYARCIDYLV